MRGQMRVSGCGCGQVENSRMLALYAPDLAATTTSGGLYAIMRPMRAVGPRMRPLNLRLCAIDGSWRGAD
jgi:hypothetical protein